MHQNPEFKIIAECREGYIGVCECCQEFNFAFKNVLLTFQEEEMIAFFEWMIAGRDSCENCTQLYHGRNRIFSGPHSNLFLVYNDEEMDEMIRMFHEVMVLIEARNLLSGNRLN